MDVQGNRNELLRSLSPAIAARLDAELQTVSLPAGNVISEPGDDVDYALFPHTGMVSLLAAMRDGSAVETATVGREGAIGAMTGLGPHVTLTRAAVQTPLVASRINAVSLRRLVQGSEELRDLVVRYNEVLLAQVQTTAACNAVHSLEARLSRWILQSRDRIDEDAIPLTHEILSQMLGVRRSSVSEVAKKAASRQPDFLQPRQNHDPRSRRARTQRLRVLPDHQGAFRRQPEAAALARLIHAAQSAAAL